MNILTWLFSTDIGVEEIKDGYKKVSIEEVAIGDEIKGIGTVTDKYKFLGDWAVWSGYKEFCIEKRGKVWVKQ